MHNIYMFCTASVAMLALMLVPIPWVHGWKMKNVNHHVSDRCIAYHAVSEATAYANHANETIDHQIQAQALQYPTMILGHVT